LASPAPAMRQSAASALDGAPAAAAAAPRVAAAAKTAKAKQAVPTPATGGSAAVAAVEAGAPLAAWISSLVVLVGLFVAVVVLREPIMGIWPASQRLYAAMGLYHPQ